MAALCGAAMPASSAEWWRRGGCGPAAVPARRFARQESQVAAPLHLAPRCEAVTEKQDLGPADGVLQDGQAGGEKASSLMGHMLCLAVQTQSGY